MESYGDGNEVEDEEIEDEGVTRAEPSGDFLQTGHVAFILSHSSTQLAWK